MNPPFLYRGATNMERKNLWAPWRIAYIRGLGKKHDCFLCHNIAHPEEDCTNYVLWRTKLSVVMFNRFPYNNGHMLIAPLRHFGDLESARDEELTELFKLVRDVQAILKLAVNPGGFNVGINMGRCAGAGVPDHIHIHVVPRWDGDTNFMGVCNDVEVISQGMDELYQQLVKISGDKKFPRMQYVP